MDGKSNEKASANMKKEEKICLLNIGEKIFLLRVRIMFSQGS